MTETNERIQAEKRKRPQPFWLPLPPLARVKIRQAGVYCQPRVFREYQAGAKRHVLKGVESGGAVRDLGHYVVFCDPEGRPLAWLQPVESIGANGPHAVVIAPSLVSVEMFRVQQTYDLLIAKHELGGGTPGQRLRMWSEILFYGRQGHLSLELWGRDREAAGRIAPEFFTRAGERLEIPSVFVAAAMAATKGATCIGCNRAQYAHAPGFAAEPPAAESAEQESALPAAGSVMAMEKKVVLP